MTVESAKAETRALKAKAAKAKAVQAKAEAEDIKAEAKECETLTQRKSEEDKHAAAAEKLFDEACGVWLSRDKLGPQATQLFKSALIEAASTKSLARIQEILNKQFKDFLDNEKSPLTPRSRDGLKRWLKAAGIYRNTKGVWKSKVDFSMLDQWKKAVLEMANIEDYRPPVKPPYSGFKVKGATEMIVDEIDKLIERFNNMKEEKQGITKDEKDNLQLVVEWFQSRRPVIKQ